MLEDLLSGMTAWFRPSASAEIDPIHQVLNLPPPEPYLSAAEVSAILSEMNDPMEGLSHSSFVSTGYQLGAETVREVRLQVMERAVDFLERRLAQDRGFTYRGAEEIDDGSISTDVKIAVDMCESIGETKGAELAARYVAARMASLGESDSFGDRLVADLCQMAVKFGQYETLRSRFSAYTARRIERARSGECLDVDHEAVSNLFTTLRQNELGAAPLRGLVIASGALAGSNPEQPLDQESWELLRGLLSRGWVAHRSPGDFLKPLLLSNVTERVREDVDLKTIAVQAIEAALGEEIVYANQFAAAQQGWKVAREFELLIDHALLVNRLLPAALACKDWDMFTEIADHASVDAPCRAEAGRVRVLNALRWGNIEAADKIVELSGTAPSVSELGALRNEISSARELAISRQNLDRALNEAENLKQFDRFVAQHWGTRHENLAANH